MSDERSFRRWFVTTWSNWLCPVEPRRGGAPGIPDLLVMMPPGHPWSRRDFPELTPIELKVGEVNSLGNLAFVLRPVQRAWLAKFIASGGHVVVAVGVGSETGWQVYGLVDPSAHTLINHKAWPLDHFVPLASPDTRG